ncbi:MAG: ABC transporter substrate-binding protein [Beijerinckiaceae bacterium]|nr:ABC transporter substrate-binding protein [Beijerinckiaceae bacterium]MCZ8300250.1 ABC transporter substrate-binding protein [Beijerinckiaceae bacterium]
MGPWAHNRVLAQGAAKPIMIGTTTDASGQYANSGADERRGILMAIEEANARGGILGRKLVSTHIDTETTPATGSRVAERMIQQEKCGFLLGGVHSGVANAISQVAQKYGVIYFNTNSSSPTEAGQNCHRVKFVWDGNGTNFAKAAIKNSINAFGGTFVLLTNDYVWGHDTARTTKKQIAEFGGKVLEEILIPQGTRDFTAALIKIQQLKPSIVAAAIGGDDQKALRQQVAQLGMGNKPVWLNNQQDWPDVYGLPADNLFGVFGTTWYHELTLPSVKEFVEKYKKMYPNEVIKVPGNVFYNGYMAARELFAAIERAGTTNNIAVIKALEGHVMKAGDRMQHYDAMIDAKTHQVQQTIYLATANPRPKDKDDLFALLAQAEPKDVIDLDAPAACKLESYEATPTFDA